MGLTRYPGGVQVKREAQDVYSIHMDDDTWTKSRYKDAIQSFKDIHEEYAGKMLSIQTPYPVPKSIQRILDREHFVQICLTESRVDEDLVLAAYIGVGGGA